MYVDSGEIKPRDYLDIARDYYEKFEKESGEVSVFKNRAIRLLGRNELSFILTISDTNYSKTMNFLNENDLRKNAFITSLKNDFGKIAYAVVIQPDLNINEFVINDIIFRSEHEIEDLANGEISMRKNIYNIVAKNVEEIISEVYDDYLINYKMVDSKDLVEILLACGYKCDQEINENSHLNELTFTKIVNKKERNGELRLTRK